MLPMTNSMWTPRYSLRTIAKRSFNWRRSRCRPTTRKHWPLVTAPARQETPPDWVTVTPHECDYVLEMSAGGLDCQPCETVNVTRAEYLELKRALAKMEC
jgi:hypothetical protein